MSEKQIETAQKYDVNKNRVELLDVEWLEGVGRVLTFGATKYAPNNWRKGFAWSRLAGACLRHVYAFMRGEHKDPESGESHLLHAACCLMFLYVMTIHRSDLNDLQTGTEAEL